MESMALVVSIFTGDPRSHEDGIAIEVAETALAR